MVILAALAGLLGAAARPVAGQNSLCDVDLSEVSALLTRAQAASAGGDAAAALALVNRADERLAALLNRCDLPAVTVDAPTGETVTGAGYTLTLPAGWSVNGEAAAAGGALLIGSTPEAARAMAEAEPALAPGQAGMLIVYGPPAQITNGTLRAGDLEAVTRFFQIALGSQYLLEGDPVYLTLNGRAAATVTFAGGGFDGQALIIEVAPGQFAVVAASAPRGELNALLPTVQAVAASLAPAAQEG
jgi:hypothetical protein